MKFSRRDWFTGAAGIAAGMVFTPVPWKLLGDVSIWTQNWPWIPQAAPGPVETKQSVCTLCASGCGIRVRMAAGWPVGISGVASNPITKGALCPLAFAAQQLNWHPQRLHEVRHRARTASWADAQTAFERACSEGSVAVVDGRQGRATSSILEAFAKQHGGSYRVVLDEQSQALMPYASWSGTSVAALGYDLENARTIVSFGAPLLDGWGTPGQFTRLWSEKAAGTADPQLRLIQIEPKLSPTAARAWRWTAIHQGSDAALAAGLAQVLVKEHLLNEAGPVPAQMSLLDAATQTGLSSDAIRELAHTMVERRPVVAIVPDGNPAIAALNVLLGAVGAPGGIVAKSKAQGTCLPLEAGGAYRAMLLDATVPWEFVPQTNAEVFRFAAWDGGGNKADWLLPAPGFAEELTDVPSAQTSALETYAIAVNLLAQPRETKTAAQFLQKVDATLPDVDKAIHARCEKLFHGKAGSVDSEQAIAVAKFESAAKLEEQLRQGAIWVGDAPHTGGLKCALKQWPAATNPSHAVDWAAAWEPPVFPPLAAKLYQESDLREPPVRRPA